MKRPLGYILLVLIVGLTTGCTYFFAKKDVPPPLPPVIETKPPLKVTVKCFDEFPWKELSPAKKDGNDPDTTTVTLKEGQTLESVAEDRMGNPAMAEELARYNALAGASSAKAGDQIVIPNPIIGVKSEIMIKTKGSKQFADPVSFGAEFKKGDQYKLRFETNVNGHCYIFRKGIKTITSLYPLKAKQGRRNRTRAPLYRDSSTVKAGAPIEIPIGKAAFKYDEKKKGDVIYVFLSLKEIPELEDALKSKNEITMKDIEDIRVKVREDKILADKPYHLLRMLSPSDILGFSLDIDG